MCVPPGVAPWASIPGKHTDAGAGGDGDDSLLIEMFWGGEQRLSSYPELLLQAQPVVGSPGVVKPVEMALQRAHIQLGVSVQEVLQQSLVDEGVLHLRERRHQRGGRTLVLSNLSASVLASQPPPSPRSLGLFAPRLQRAGSAVSPWSRGVGRGQRLHLSG